MPKTNTKIFKESDTQIKKISKKEAMEFVYPRHYSGRKPNYKLAFGWYLNGRIIGACVFGKPASPPLCRGICGEEFKLNVYELNRVVKLDEIKLQISYFISKCLKIVSELNWIVVSYADTRMNHIGYLYQACNFIYTGKTKSRTDKYTEGNKHAIRYDNKVLDKRVVRSAKHRYVYFAFKNKSQRKYARSKLNYPVMPYPKGDNSRYTLGEYIKPIVVDVK